MDSSDALREVHSYVLDLLGTSNQHNPYSLDRIIQQRMGQLGLQAPGAYLKVLREQSDERDRCISAVTIKETYFFREQSYITLVTDQIIPRLLSKKPTVNILSAGCSIGAEAYSIAIGIHERYGLQGLKRCRILGIDVDRQALTTARSGIYTHYALRTLSNTRMQKYFIRRTDRSFELIPEIRRAVSFQQVNLFDQQEMGKLDPADVLFYRNVSIYFDMDRRIQTFTNLAHQLSKWGVLITGASETLAHDIGVLSLTSEGGLFFFMQHPGESLSVPVEISQEPIVIPPPVRAESAEKPLESVLRKALGGDYEGAWRQLQKTHVSVELELNSKILHAGILYNLKRFDEAQLLCDQMTKAEPMRMEAYLIRAMILRLQNDNYAALAELKKVMYIEPKCWVAVYYSGELYRQLLEKPMAQMHFRRVIVMLEQKVRNDRLLVFPINRISSDQVIRLCRHALDKL